MKILISLFLTNLIVETIKYLKFSVYIKSNGYNFSDETNTSSIRDALLVLILNLIPAIGTVLAVCIFYTDDYKFLQTALKKGHLKKL